MNIEQIRDICMSMPEAVETQCFGEDTVVFKVRGKMFAMLMFIPKYCRYIFLKCDPDYALLLRESHIGVVEPAWHMNKRYWNMTDFEHPSMDVVFARHIVAHSYNEVLKKMPRRLCEGLSPLTEGDFKLD
ncbi:MAG: MmcQ/YjbR family DNA-binding protein [Bacteroidales bacterium]|nr:MmcQ/YjbR family DNA-binding protein [Bacteroidales bacterium]